MAQRGVKGYVPVRRTKSDLPFCTLPDLSRINRQHDPKTEHEICHERADAFDLPSR